MESILRPGRILFTIMMLIALVGGAKLIVSAARAEIPIDEGDDKEGPPVSGVLDFRDVDFGNGLTECPQAGFRPSSPKPLDQRDKDQVERISEGGDDRRTNLEYSCFPQDETSIAINPLNPRNIVGGANDYRLGWGASGFYASTDNGENWYGGIRPFPTPITSTAVAIRPWSSIARASPTTPTSTSSARTTRVASSCPAPRTADSPGRGRAFHSTSTARTRARCAAAWATRASPAMATWRTTRTMTRR